MHRASLDPNAAPELDIAWIEDLPRFVKDSIDNAYSQRNERRAIGRAVERSDAFAEYVAAARAERNVALRGGEDSSRPDRAGRAAIQSAYEADVAAFKNAQIHERSQTATVRYRRPSRSVVPVPRQGFDISWNLARVAMRVDFMSWGIDALGSADAVKAHFGNMRLAFGRIPLFGPSARRLEAAKAQFEEEHPGVRFPRVACGFSLRGRHQAQHSAGMLMHPLGLAVDILGLWNIMQDDERLRSLLDRFAVRDDDQPSSRFLGNRNRRFVTEMGRRTQAGQPITEQQQAWLDTIDDEFEIMLESSRAFRGSLPESSVERLRESFASWPSIRNRLRAIEPREQRLATRLQQLAAQEAANTENPRPGRTTRLTARRQELESEQQALIALREPLDADIAALTNLLEEVFAPWLTSIDNDLAATPEGIDHQLNDNRLRFYDRFAERIEGTTQARQLTRLLQQNRRNTLRIRNLNHDFDQAAEAPESEETQAAFETRRDSLAQSLRTVLAQQRNFHARSGILALRESLTSDFSFVFGQPKRDGSRALAARNPSVLQLVERGFVFDNESENSERQGAFDGRAIRIMAQHGFECGGFWTRGTDTMHFDDRVEESVMRNDRHFSPDASSDN